MVGRATVAFEVTIAVIASPQQEECRYMRLLNFSAICGFVESIFDLSAQVNASQSAAVLQAFFAMLPVFNTYTIKETTVGVTVVCFSAPRDHFKESRRQILAQGREVVRRIALRRKGC